MPTPEARTSAQDLLLHLVERLHDDPVGLLAGERARLLAASPAFASLWEHLMRGFDQAQREAMAACLAAIEPLPALPKLLVPEVEPLPLEQEYGLVADMPSAVFHAVVYLPSFRLGRGDPRVEPVQNAFVVLWRLILKHGN
jgi:hypothetical protein